MAGRKIGRIYEGLARVSVGRFMNSGKFFIEIKDDASSTYILKLGMGGESFARMLTGQGDVEASMVYYHNDVVGKILENKTELVSLGRLSPYSDEGRAKARTLAKKLEVDGWVANLADADNGHRYIKEGNGITFSFHRYVDKKE